MEKEMQEGIQSAVRAIQPKRGKKKKQAAPVPRVETEGMRMLGTAATAVGLQGDQAASGAGEALRRALAGDIPEEWAEGTSEG